VKWRRKNVIDMNRRKNECNSSRMCRTFRQTDGRKEGDGTTTRREKRKERNERKRGSPESDGYRDLAA